MADQISQAYEDRDTAEIPEIPKITAIHNPKRLGGGRSATIWGPYAFSQSIDEQNKLVDEYKFYLKNQHTVADLFARKTRGTAHPPIEFTDKIPLSAHHQAKETQISLMDERSNIAGLNLALKRQAPGCRRDIIRNEYKVLTQLDLPGDENLLVPICYGFLDDKHPTWQDILPNAPEGTRANSAILSEMIPSISDHAKAYLYEYHYGLGEDDFMLEEMSRIFKVVHPYFGRRVDDLRSIKSHNEGRLVHSVNRGNFVVRVDQMESHPREFGQGDYQKWAGAMGRGLAYLHWRARVDGYGVEFILGGARDKPCSTLGSHQIWMLDFDRCASINPMTSDGLNAISNAFWRNRPQTPRPGSPFEADYLLWLVFAYEYRRVGRNIVRSYQEKGESLYDLIRQVDNVICAIEQQVPVLQYHEVQYLKWPVSKPLDVPQNMYENMYGPQGSTYCYPE